MRTLIIKTALVGAGLAAGVAAVLPAAGGAATTTTTPTTVTAPPVQGTAPRNVTMYVDTIQGSGGSPKPAAGCAITNLFEQGQVVVFRMWGTNGAGGGIPLTDQTVKSAYVTIPGTNGTSTQLKLAYAAHGTVAYWTTPWFTTTTTPVGVVNFTVTVTTDPIPGVRAKVRVPGTKRSAHKFEWVWTKKPVPSLTGTFTQQGFPSISQLTITTD